MSADLIVGLAAVVAVLAVTVWSLVDLFKAAHAEERHRFRERQRRRPF